MSLEVFYSYAHEDEDLRKDLEKHLSLLQRNGWIVSWNDRCIRAGDEWRNQIDAHVRSAHIVLLLISPDFIASDYCYDVEMKLALERHAKHEVIVIPIILRPVDWSGAPFGGLEALPRDAKPVTSWSNRDEAFADVARGIREVVLRFQPQASLEAPGLGFLADSHVPTSRVLDAAVPSHIVKDRATELLVLIRLPDSPGLNGVLLADEEAEARPEDVRSKPFTVTFPLGPDGKREALKVEVKLTSPDFTPPEQAKNLFVPPDGNSEVISFILTPIRTGQLRVLVELQWEDALRGSRRLLTECLAEAASLPAGAEMHVVRIPLGMSSEAVEVTGATRVFDDGPREFISMQSGSQIHKHIDLLRDGLEAPAQALKSKISRPGQTGNAEEPAPPPAPSQGETGAILRETVLRELSAKIEREPKRGGPRAGYPPMPESKPMAPRLETGETREGGVALEIRNHLSSARRKPTVVVAVIWAVALALAALAVIYLSMRNH